MAWLQHHRVRYIDHVRNIIGDKDSLLFTDDELKSYIEKWMTTDIRTATVTAYNSRYRVACGCFCSYGQGIYLLNITTGVEDAVYILDEGSNWIIFDPDDPANLAVEPTDGDQIDIEYYSVTTHKLISELFFVLSSNHAKLNLAHNIMGVNMDMRALSDSFYDQSVRWEIEHE